MKNTVTLPVKFKASYKRVLLALPGSCIIALIAFVSIYCGIRQGQPFAIVLGGAFVALLIHLAKAVCTTLTLHDRGFVIASFSKQIEVKWTDILDISTICLLGMQCNIGWHFTEEHKKTRMTKLERALCYKGLCDRFMTGLYRGISVSDLSDLMNRIRLAAIPVPPISPEQRFALATSAILSEVNAQSHTILQGDLPSYTLTTNSKEILKSAWGVSTEIELIDCLTWLKKTGDRREYEDIICNLPDYFEHLDPLQLLKPEAEAMMNKKEKNDFKREVFCVQKYSARHKSILAWDLCRLVSVSRFGAGANYLNDDDAWQWILDAASTLRHAFSSWQEMADNYLVGREFCAIDHENNRIGIAVKKLLDKNNSLSPWNSIPWNPAPKVYGIECGTITADLPAYLQ